MAEASPSTRGRILAALFPFVIIAGITAQVFIAERLVVVDDAAKTAANIVANKSLYRLGYTIFMLEMVAQVGVSLLFYDLLKPVNRSVARASAVLGLTGCGIKTMARLFYYAPLILPTRRFEGNGTDTDLHGLGFSTGSSTVSSPMRFWFE